ncbi:MAG TPA: SusE domain-containing protein, partial [Flavobacteriaceae bacterium]|nr:SusE domain-containing protein [Flavobacteriaceae bacterium]
YKIIYFFCLSLLVLACTENEPEKIQIEAVSIGAINTPTNGDTFVLNPAEDSGNTAITISWDSADYGYQTGINYTVEFGLTGNDFASPVVVGTTTNRFLSMDVSELNTACVLAGLAPFVEGNVDIRIKSYVGTQNGLPQYSEAITILVTPFTTDLPKIAVPGNHQGWNPGTAPLLAASGFGETDYEGYVWLDGIYQFLAPDSSGNFDWGTTQWGDDGTFTGKLLIEGRVDCTSPAGYYFVQADTDALTYSTTAYDWGLIGSATPDGWDSDQDMTYDADSRTWVITLDLSADEIKFRANDDWGWNYGDTGADGELSNDGDNIVVPQAGNYTVVLDLSNPREYTYSLTLN